VWVKLLPQHSRLGNLRGGPAQEGVAILDVSTGGGTLPEIIVFYGADGRIIGDASLGSYVSKVRIVRGAVKVNVDAMPQIDDPSCCGTVDAVTTFRWNRSAGRMVSTSRTFDERWALNRVIGLVQNDKIVKARRLASGDLVRMLDDFDDRRASFAINSCVGELFGFPVHERQCTVAVRLPSGAVASTIVVEMDRRGFKKWFAELG
jgi:hypothetical protein